VHQGKGDLIADGAGRVIASLGLKCEAGCGPDGHVETCLLVDLLVDLLPPLLEYGANVVEVLVHFREGVRTAGCDFWIAVYYRQDSLEFGEDFDKSVGVLMNDFLANSKEGRQAKADREYVQWLFNLAKVMFDLCNIASIARCNDRLLNLSNHGLTLIQRRFWLCHRRRLYGGAERRSGKSNGCNQIFE